MVSFIDRVKYLVSMALLGFSIAIVMALILEEDTRISRDVHSGVAIVVFWAGILWMSMVKGGQCFMVGLPPVNRDLYEHSHPITYKITYLSWPLGRQYVRPMIAHANTYGQHVQVRMMVRI
jgi:hypothetical protein